MSRKEDVEKMFEVVSKLDDTVVKYLLREAELALFVQNAERERFSRLNNRDKGEK